ncbi:NAD(P)-binding protein [Mytilinidion resinicola]|uniref:NAD(P)-binding protein n=1 Tax=Mytilinidion resinicola TaxID=574789 RepID=A0A6A6Y3J4_9PEZI|nr:NAD(P)-binding protein [Mytilinidion resinicola]KAF2803088.1 NAD(P)-binding protein [Mytilinidion resinicola]
MTSNLARKVFTITAGASGMGKATSRLLAQRGAAVVCIGDFNDKNFVSVKKEIAESNPNTEVVTTKLDVSEPSQVKSWIDSVLAMFGRLDGSANIAGVPQASNARQKPTILEETDEAWRRTMAVNIDGIMYCTREQVRGMVSLPVEPSGRAIVNVASLASMMHTPDTYAYGASKRACASFSSSVAKDVLGFGIRVNTVSPGATLTPMMAQFFPDGTSEEAIKGLGMYMIEPEDIARAIVYLLSEESDKISGVNLAVGAGHSLA